MTQQIREHLAANRDKRFNNASLREALDTDDAKEISNGLFALKGEIKREKTDGHGTEYWMPSNGATAPPPPMTPNDVAVRLVKQRAAAASVAKPKNKATLAKPAKKEKPARKTGKRKYTRRAAPPPAGFEDVGTCRAAHQRPAGVLLRHQRGRRYRHHLWRKQDRAEPHRRPAPADLPQNRRTTLELNR